ncbi:MAG TPA: hypothetical protein VKD72_14250, partial [Gemmataceae bacterium]|nr:hypothetical protein [Gemmataceae bacterium]
PDGKIRLKDVTTGEDRGGFTGPHGKVRSLAFSPDGRTLASGSSDSTILLWDVTGLAQPERTRPAELTPEDLEDLWDDLAAASAATSYQALKRLAAAGAQAVAFANRHLRPVPAPDRQRIARWIADLDSERFAAREEATAALAELEELAVPALRQAAEKQPSAEAARRIEKLIEQQETAVPPPEKLRALRAVELLEIVATPEALRVLETLAGGAPEARLSRDAKASRDRLARR